MVVDNSHRPTRMMTAKLNCVVLKHGKRLKNRITKAFINIQN